MIDVCYCEAAGVQVGASSRGPSLFLSVLASQAEGIASLVDTDLFFEHMATLPCPTSQYRVPSLARAV